MGNLIQQFKQRFSNQYIQNVGWLGIAELVNRVFRLGTTVTLARVFSTQDYGLMAIIYTTFDIASVFTLKQGISGKIIQTGEEQLPQICKTAYWLNWLVCTIIFLIQCFTAVLISLAYENTDLILPMCAVATIYLMFPVFMVQSSLVMRENRLKVTAVCNAFQSLVNNVITIVMALCGFGIWSIVAGMVVSTPVWIIVNLRSHPWRPPSQIQFHGWRQVVSFGRNLLLIELLQKLRDSLDYLIIGPILGLEPLGFYFFAYNAGSGITTNVVHAMVMPLFPRFCESRQSPKRLQTQYLSSLKLMTLVLGGVIFVQCSLAPFYVPIIFGEKWKPAIPILMIICLSILPRAYGWAAGALLNAQDKTHLTLISDVIFTLAFALALFIAVSFGIFWVAIAVCLTHFLLLIPFTAWVNHSVFSRRSETASL
jgi:O-antigen/teichoic acid export membrane protein